MKTPDAARTHQQEVQDAMNQAYVNGQWVEATPMRRATWLEVLLDRWIGPHTGHPWRSVLKGILGRA